MINLPNKLLNANEHILDHVGFIVNNTEVSVQSLAPLLGIISCSYPVIDEKQDVKAIFAKTNQGLVLEFLEPLSDQSPIKNSLNKSSNLIHHLAYRTDDLERSTQVIRELKGMPIVAAKPGIAFDNALIQFFLLSDGWLIELIEQFVSTMEFPIKL